MSDTTPSGAATATPILTPELAKQMLPAPPDLTSQVGQLVPAMPTQSALAVYATGEASQKLVCANLLTPHEQEKAKAEAKTLVPQLVGNINVLMAYATDTADALNKLVDDALDKDKTGVEEIDALMRQMQDQMRGVGSKYDVSVPDIRKKFEKNRTRVLGVLWQGKTMLQMLIQESQSAAHQVDGIGKKVHLKADQAMDDANLFAQLLRHNEDFIHLFTYRIAVLEYARSDILDEFNSIQVDASDPSQHDLIVKRDILGKVLNALNIRIGDFQARLIDAHGSSAEFSDWVQANFDLALKLDFLWRIGIPAIKETLLVWQKNASAVGKAKTINAIGTFYNEAKQQSAQAGAAGIKEVEVAAQSPVMLAETMQIILKAAQDRAQNVLDAAKAGTDARLRFAEGAQVTIRGLQEAQANLQEGLANQAASEAETLRAAMEAQNSVALIKS